MEKIIIESKVHGVLEVLVDDEDFEELNKYKWHAAYRKHTFYAQRHITIDGKKTGIMMHRVVMKLQNGNRLFVDHKNFNGLDNQKSNLRIVTQQQNNRNTKNTKGSSSKYKGVHWSTGVKKWVAQITVNYQNINLGSHEIETEAAKAYNTAALQHFGEFANLNIIN